MSLSSSVRNLRYSSRVDRVVVQRESHLVMAILTRRQPSEEVFGVMMSLDPSERVGSLPSSVCRLVLKNSNPSWGDWRRSFGFLVVFLLYFGWRAIFKSVGFAFSRNGLPCSAWSKKNVF